MCACTHTHRHTDNTCSLEHNLRSADLVLFLLYWNINFRFKMRPLTHRRTVIMQWSNVVLIQWQCLLEVCIQTEASSACAPAWAVLSRHPWRPMTDCSENKKSTLSHWELWVIHYYRRTLPILRSHLPLASFCWAPLWVKGCWGQGDWPFLMPAGLLSLQV